MELPTTPRLSREPAPFPACAQYLERLPLSPERRSELLESADGSAASDAASVMARVHQAIARDAVASDNPAYESIQGRLELAYGAQGTDAVPTITREVRKAVRVVSAPALNRTPMAPRLWPPTMPFQLLRRFGTHASRPEERLKARLEACPESPDPRGRWHRVGTLRRIALGVVVGAQTYLATHFMTAVLPYHGSQPLEIGVLVFFAVLFCWVSAGFWTAIAGFFLLLFGRDRYAISATASSDAAIDPHARTAVVMPICNEKVPRVFAGLRATYESLSRTGELHQFDFYVLSDTNDPDTRIAETSAWLDLCRAVGGFGRVFYRWRQHRIKRKSGNIADFCRRWGRNYRYMVVLDADSVMSGECLTTLLRLMEANPNAGIIQTAPCAVGHDTLYARVQQFANRVYGPIYTAGMHFFQLGEAFYWGHNAIIRVAPFIRHCALGRLPGDGTLSGEILSHDFVEAALMRRAGWAVWIAYDLPGSYEEMPPNLVDELKRDRRWCQGNLINSRLCLAKGLHPAHRAVFLTGVMAYVSAPLWFVFLMLSTALLAVHTLVAPEYFTRPMQLFPLWPEWHPARGIGLYTATATLLFLPKILSVALAWVQRAKRFGGGLRLASSMAAELVFSALLAPIRMLFHTQFVVAALCGWSVQWKSPPREDAETSWADALRHHGVHTLLGLVWATVVYWLNPAFLWWLLPVVGALMVSIPISVYSSRVSLGRRLRAARFFVTPEESQPPKELRWTWTALEDAPGVPAFVEAVVDPVTNALACASAGVRYVQGNFAGDKRTQLLQQALRSGPGALTVPQKVQLLRDPAALSQLHFQVWASPLAHPGWLQARSAQRGDGESTSSQHRGYGTPLLATQPALEDWRPQSAPASWEGSAAHP
jgi:membrane glycosyltransferase